jgi:hypothetical protein
MQKTYQQKVIGKTSIQTSKLDFILFYTTKLQKFLAVYFSECTFFQLFQLIWNQRKTLLIFDIHM